MDAQTLFRQGVIAIRDQKDVTRGRDLLMQSLQIDPTNDMAWLWLTHTVTDPDKRLQYIERALAINPQNEHARNLRNRLLTSAAPAAPIAPVVPAAPTVPPVAAPQVPAVIEPPQLPAIRRELTPSEQKQIESLLNEAEAALTMGDVEGAIGRWVAILQIQVDHEIAIRNAVLHLWRLNYKDDAKELIWRALQSGTVVPSVILTAIDIAEREQDLAQVETLRSRVASLPDTDEKLILAITEQYTRSFKFTQAIDFLQRAVASHPGNQAILTRLGDLYSNMGRATEALKTYEEAVRLKPRTREAREADRKLLNLVPALTDRERGSVLLATREVVGIGFVYLLMGWQDAGLNLLSMGLLRWLGVLLSLVGGYLLITATSSPQQVPLAARLGGAVPVQNKPREPGIVAEEETHLPIIPMDIRIFLGLIGAALLVLAFGLVFHEALHLLFDYHPPYIPEIDL